MNILEKAFTETVLLAGQCVIFRPHEGQQGWWEVTAKAVRCVACGLAAVDGHSRSLQQDWQTCLLVFRFLLFETMSQNKVALTSLELKL